MEPLGVMLPTKLAGSAPRGTNVRLRPARCLHSRMCLASRSAAMPSTTAKSSLLHVRTCAKETASRSSRTLRAASAGRVSKESASSPTTGISSESPPTGSMMYCPRTIPLARRAVATAIGDRAACLCLPAQVVPTCVCVDRRTCHACMCHALTKTRVSASSARFETE